MADSAQGLQLRELKDTISELNKLIKTLQQTVEAVSIREAELRQERDNLKEQIDYLTKRLFGSSSEKGKCDIPGQLNLFNEPEAEACGDPGSMLSMEETLCQEEPKVRKKRTVDAERLKGCKRQVLSSKKWKLFSSTFWQIKSSTYAYIPLRIVRRDFFN